MYESQVIINLENDLNIELPASAFKHMKYARWTFDNYTQNYKHSMWHLICLCPSFMLLNYVSHRFPRNTRLPRCVFVCVPSPFSKVTQCTKWHCENRRKKHDQQWKQNFIARSKNASNSWVMSVYAVWVRMRMRVPVCARKETLRKIWRDERT